MRAASRLAQRHSGPAPVAPAQARQYLTFIVAGEVFGIAIAHIKEILEHRDPTPVPMMPPFMRGVINLRGKVVPVVDLSARFYQQPGQTTRRSCFVILELNQEAAGQEIGVLVDAVSAVVDIPDEHIEPPPHFGARLRADFISGMGRMGERFVILLEVDKVLSIEELASLGGSAEAAAACEPVLQAAA